MSKNNRQTLHRALLALAVALALGAPALAAGLMKPKDGSLPDLEIAEHRVSVVINNGYAVTEVDQLFRNPHDRDLDAIYSFPLPEAASLSELSLWIDGQEVVGEVVAKQQARRIVHQEREAGRESALAEQREYYAFDVLVSPVRAASTTRVRLVYLQPIEIDNGVGRYVYPLEEGEIDEEMRAFWDRQSVVHGTFEFEATLRSSYPLDDVRATGFPGAVVNQDAPDTWKVWIDGERGQQSEQGQTRLESDIVLYYRLAPNQPARVDLLPYREGDGPGTFMLVVTPGVDLEQTTGGVDWVVVLDTSGSMSSKIGTASDAVARALDQMRPQDRYRLFAFANSAREITSGWQSVVESNVERTRNAMSSINSKGGTNLYAGFQAGLQALDPDRPAALLLVSDGGANVGPTEQADFLSLLARQDVRVFTFVLGQGANRPLLGRLADASGGFSMDVSNQDDLYGRLLQAKVKLGHQAMHGVRVDLAGARMIDAAPQRLPSAYLGEQIVLFGRYVDPGPAKLQLSAKISGQDRSFETEIDLPAHDATYPEVERLWALARTRDLQRQIDDGGDASELRQAIVDIGTGYSIVTGHTSMVVVREDRFEELGIERRNHQRVTAERVARATRAKKKARPTRADRSRPMFGDRSAGGGSGTGAAGPAFVGLLIGLYGLRCWTRRNGRER